MAPFTTSPVIRTDLSVFTAMLQMNPQKRREREFECLFIFVRSYVYLVASQNAWAKEKRREWEHLDSSVMNVWVFVCKVRATFLYLWRASWLADMWTSRPFCWDTSWASLSRLNWFTSHICCWCCKWRFRHTCTSKHKHIKKHQKYRMLVLAHPCKKTYIWLN